MAVVHLMMLRSGRRGRRRERAVNLEFPEQARLELGHRRGGQLKPRRLGHLQHTDTDATKEMRCKVDKTGVVSSL